MHYKRFRRPTVREALAAVKTELGPEALVLSTRMVPSPGMSGWMGARLVEVTAVLDRTEPVDQTEGVDMNHVSAPRIDASADRRLESSKADVPGSRHSDSLAVHARGVAARLEASGIDPAVARVLASHPAMQARGAGSPVIRRALAEQLASLMADDTEGKAIEVFIGPPGAGKTTTIAKVAAQARARRSTRFGLVAADGFRVGAVEQLRLYAGILDSPFCVARSGDELAQALDGVRGPLLVDTAGRSPADGGAADILQVLAGRDDVRRHLVLPAGTAPADARRVIARFAPAAPDRLVLSRLDEVQSVGPLLGVIADAKLPLSYFTNGQNVPDDLQRATAPALADWVLGEWQGACA